VPFLLKDLGAQVAGERITDCSGSSRRAGAIPWSRTSAKAGTGCRCSTFAWRGDEVVSAFEPFGTLRARFG
jgi:hypothetical protein